jgi:hypothetical protein
LQGESKMTASTEQTLFEQLISRLRVAATVMENLPEIPGYNGSIVRIDDVEAEEIAKTLNDAADELGKFRPATDSGQALFEKIDAWQKLVLREEYLADQDADDKDYLDELRAICAEHDKRLADAEKQIEKYYVIVGQRDESINALTSLYEKCVDSEIALSQQVAQRFSDELERVRAESADSVKTFLQSDLFQRAVCMWLWDRECKEGDPDATVWFGGPTPEPYGPAYMAAFDNDAFALRERIKREVALWDEAEKNALAAPQQELQP